jgi:hypothetical protein
VARKETGETLSGIRVTVDEKEWPAPTEGGRVAIRIPEPGEHRIRVSPVTGLEAPLEQTVSGPPFRSSRLVFLYKTAVPVIPADARLTFVATQEHVGARVRVGDRIVGGEITAPGVFNEPVPPSDSEQAIHLERVDFTHNAIRRKFAPRETVTLTADDVRLTPTVGTVVFKFPDPPPSIRFHRVGSTEFVHIGHEPARLPPGEYEFEATAPGRKPAKVVLKVIAGQTSEAVFRFEAEIPQYSIRDFEKPQEWSAVADSAWFKRKGSGSVRFGITPPIGRIGFSWIQQQLQGLPFLRRGQTLRWAIDLRDEANYLGFEFDGTTLKRYVVSKGNRQSEVRPTRRASRPKDENQFALVIDVKSEEITTLVKAASGTELFNDTWSIAGRDLSKGKFAFRIQGDEELWISNFVFFSLVRSDAR